MPTPAHPADGSTPYAALVGIRNDAFRRSVTLGPGLLALPGEVRLDPEIAYRGPRFRDAALRAVAADDRFPIERDPYGDRSQGRVAVEGVRVDWRIDLQAPGTAAEHRILSIGIARPLGRGLRITGTTPRGARGRARRIGPAPSAPADPPRPGHRP